MPTILLRILPQIPRISTLTLPHFLHLGERDVDLESLRAIPERNKFRLVQGSDCRYLGVILFNLSGSHIAEADYWIHKAIEDDGKNGVRFNLGLDHALYADFFKQQGDRTQAQEQFGRAIDILRDSGADGWVEKYEKKLAALL